MQHRDALAALSDQQLVLRPQPPVPSTIRKLPSTRAASSAAARTEEPITPGPVDLLSSAMAIAPQPARRPVIVPLSEEHYKIQVTFTRKAHDRLRQAVQRPKPPRDEAPKGRHVPADVKRKVWIRDAGQCAFKSGDGRRCSETGCLEYHHVVPFAAGGKATVENIEMRCRAHNGYEAERYFGTDVTSLFRETATSYQ